MNSEGSAIQTTIPPVLSSERSVFLPHGRIGVLSMLFRWFVWFLLVLGTGFLLPRFPESSQNLFVAVVLYPGYVLLFITAIKRGHDMGYSAWGVIILLMLPVLLLLPGDKQPNRYGPVPTRKL